MDTNQFSPGDYCDVGLSRRLGYAVVMTEDEDGRWLAVTEEEAAEYAAAATTP